jgi:DNA-binding response OmpR family regulator
MPRWPRCRRPAPARRWVAANRRHATPAATSARYADLELDEDAHEVRRGGKLVDLSPTEFNLLRYLLVNAGRVVSKAQILDRVWNYDFGPAGRAYRLAGATVPRGRAGVHARCRGPRHVHRV